MLPAMRDDAKKTRVVTVRLSEPVYAVLDKLARADRRKLAAFVALILEDFVSGQEAGKGKAEAARSRRER